MIDLRSDTSTVPSLAMRQAMFEAQVGDDMWGEDPTVNQLEAECCQIFQKEAAVFCCSGTQANQAAIWAHCRPGDEILIEQQSHVANYEGGAPAILSGVTLRTLPGQGGLLDLPDLEGKIRARDQHFAQTRLLSLENTTNIGGGRFYPWDQLKRVTDWGRAHGLRVHLDGARIFNACLAGGYEPAAVGGLFDTLSVCFSKGLGCPMGSMLIGDAETIQQARRARKIFGGALRQAGIVAAAALYAMRHHIPDLEQDHRHTRLLAETLVKVPGIRLSLAEVETNILFFELDPEIITGKEFVAHCREQGILLRAVTPQRIRVVIHRDLSTEMIETAGAAITHIVSQRA